MRNISGGKLTSSVPTRKTVMCQLEEQRKETKPSSACKKEAESRRDISGHKKPKKYSRERHQYRNM
jgi:hypothetical protein